MEDLEDIRRLKARYFRSLDAKDWALYESCFTPAVVVDLTRAGGQRFEGRDAFMAYARAMPMVQSVHHGHMPEITLESPTAASGVWSLEDYNIWQDGTQHHGWGHYLENYEKIDGEGAPSAAGHWAIATMALSYLRIETEPGKPVLVAGTDGCVHLRGHRAAGLES